MSDKAEKKSETPAASDKKAASGGLLSKTPVLVGGAMVIEAVVLLAGIWIFKGNSPKSAAGAEVAANKTEGGKEGEKKEGDGGAASAEDDKKKIVEIPVVDFRAPNRKSGQTFLYDVSIFVSTKGANEETVKRKINDRSNTIRDKIRTIIAESDPDKLGGGSEPGLKPFAGK